MAREEHTPTGAAQAPTSRPAGPREAAVIGPSIRIDGDLRGEEDLRIEGEVKGTVQLKGNNLVIGSEGRVRATVYAHTVDVEGLMEGDLYCVERVNVRKSAQVKGNITAPRVSLEDGAQFKGSIEMDAQAVESAFGKSGGSVSALNAGGSSNTAAFKSSGASDAKGEGKPAAGGASA